MDVRKLAALPELRQLAEVLDDALELLASDRTCNALPARASAIQPSLFEQCIELCRQNTAHALEPIRTIHHLSCTGGTLITKCLAAMPNVMALNEVDPLSTMTFKADKPSFTPTDMPSLLRQGNQKVSDDLLVRLFLENLNLVRNEFGSIGKRLLLRDHSHSQFLTGNEVARRPTMLSMVSSRFQTISIVTVREPIDSFLSLEKLGWQHFKPNTFDEYCRRYHAFLDAYENVPVFRYEDFVSAPAATMVEICRVFGFNYSETFIDTFDTFHFSGDSGRKGATIELRPRREANEEFINNAEKCDSYIELVARLCYKK
jgi:hypothetical protein